MNNIRVGSLIRELRLEKNLTQRQLAQQMGITEQAVSKWERGLGGPEISLLPVLSEILSVNIEQILAGDLQPNDNDRGNMKRIKFYVCPDCTGVLASMGEAEISCCGRKLKKLEPHQPDADRRVQYDMLFLGTRAPVSENEKDLGSLRHLFLIFFAPYPNVV